jgi:hypothetical protein
MYWINGRGQLPMGAPPTWGLGDVLTNPHPSKYVMLRTAHSCTVTHTLINNWFIVRRLRRSSDVAAQVVTSPPQPRPVTRLPLCIIRVDGSVLQQVSGSSLHFLVPPLLHTPGYQIATGIAQAVFCHVRGLSGKCRVISNISRTGRVALM